MSIYTRTGDKGQTSLFSGKRISKSDVRVEAYGTVDELNSLIGVVLAETQISKLKTELAEIQHDLFNIGAALAAKEIGDLSYLSNRVRDFENLIDKMTEALPPLSNFILPGGGKPGSLLHFTRTVARRTERKVVRLSEKEKVDSSIIMYINRLSDLLFTMARFVNYKEKQKEIIWTKG